MFFIAVARVLSLVWQLKKFSLTCNGKNENWHLLLSHCRYYGKKFQNCLWSGPLQNIYIFSKPHNFIGCHVMATEILNLQKILKKSTHKSDKAETLQ